MAAPIRVIAEVDLPPPPHRAPPLLVGLWRTLRAHPLVNPLALTELKEERAGHPVDPDHTPHLLEAVDWLARAQDGTADDGMARGYSITWNGYFRSRGWQPSYPETTGYIIPTLLEAAEHLGRPDLAERAYRAARWETAIQMRSGAVQGGVVGQGRSPAVFNTGQVLFGWLAAFATSGEGGFADSARAAGRYLVSTLDPDGHWRDGNSLFAKGDATLYNARVAWGLAEAGVRLDEPDFLDAAARNLHAVARMQRQNGWFPHCCLSDPARPLLHTIAYTVRGLLEGGRVLEDDALLQAGARAADALLPLVRADGWLPGRFDKEWAAGASWSCLTGNAQMATNWMRLHLLTGEPKWLEPVPRVLEFIKRTQNRTSADPGLRGGIKGSAPLNGEYGRFEILNWATKYFADALIRHQQLARGTARERFEAYALA